MSETSFSSAHYPDSFPTEEQMTWDIRVPGMHNYSVVFTDHRLPEECLAGEVRLQYQGAGGKVTPLGLDAPQPRHKQGDFNLSLSNCQPNQTLDGLRLDFTVSVMRSGHPGNRQTLSLSRSPHLSLSLFLSLTHHISLSLSLTTSLSLSLFLSMPRHWTDIHYRFFHLNLRCDNEDTTLKFLIQVVI